MNFSDEDIQSLKDAHFSNEETILAVERAISDAKIDYKKVYRANIEDVKDCDLVVAVGGDGTFLEAAKYVTTQQILGVNSDPTNSYGNYCKFTVEDLKEFLRQYLYGTVYGPKYYRMRVSLDGKLQPFPAMNDVKVCHVCPVGLSRYIMTTQEKLQTTKQFSEQHDSSGIWVSTCAGSTGAMASHGGRTTYPTEKYLIYQTVGLNKLKKQDHRFEGGCVDEMGAIRFVSKMREGKVYIDGRHAVLDFPFNSVLDIAMGDPINFLNLNYKEKQ
jgi:NAD+ kinase